MCFEPLVGDQPGSIPTGIALAMPRAYPPREDLGRRIIGNVRVGPKDRARAYCPVRETLRSMRPERHLAEVTIERNIPRG